MPRPRVSSSWIVPAALAVVMSVVVALLGVVPTSAAGHERLLFIDPHRKAVDPSSYVTMVGDADEPVTLGAQLIYRADDEIWVGGDEHDVLVRIGDRDGRSSLLDLTFSAPAGRSLQPGTYVVPRLLTGSPPPGSTSMSITVGSSICYGDGGSSFTVHDIAPDLAHFWISYAMSCGVGVGTPEVRGEVRVDLPSTAPLLVTAQQVHWPASFPGRSYTAQRVHVVNPGPGAVTLGQPQVDGPFTAEATTCGVLLPGADCAVDVAYRPTTRGLESGRLVVPGPAGAGVDLPLTGVGDVGENQFAVRHRMPYRGSRDDFLTVTGPHSAYAYGDRSTIYVGFSAPHSDEHTPIVWVQVKAPPGERLEEGRTYRERTGGGYKPVEFSTACVFGRGVSTATFVFRELAFRPDGSIAALRLAAEERCLRGESFTANVSWQASAPTPAFRPVVDVAVEPGRRDGRTSRVDVTADATLGHGVRLVDLYAATRDGRQRLVGRRAVDRAGRATLRTTISRPTTFVAYAVGDAGVVARGTRSLTVLQDATVVPEGSLPSRQTVYPATTRRVRLDLVTQPMTPGARLTVQVQRLVRGRWVFRKGPGTVVMKRWGRNHVRLAVRRGEVLRVRAIWPANRFSDARVTEWSPIRVKRR